MHLKGMLFFMLIHTSGFINVDVKLNPILFSLQSQTFSFKIPYALEGKEENVPLLVH